MTGKIQTALDFGVDLLNALGLTDQMVNKIKIEVEGGSIATVDVSLLIGDSSAKIIEVIKRYKLVDATLVDAAFADDEAAEVE